ncbi:MAG: hypothetical protein MPN21_02610 [Thermoanaerobaculia bacterium]|nr:hypothetical protein [Thermoanaerobaculia bacterium]
MRPRRILAAVFVATLVGQFGASLFQPEVGTFAKYTAAIDGLRDGSVPRERLLDFSPLYLAATYICTVTAEAVGVQTAALMEVGQRVLAAVAVAAFFWLVMRRLGTAWGLLAAVLLAFDSHVLIYVGILEPEILLVALLLVLVVWLERPGRRAAVLAGLLAACAVATRPTFLPVFFLVPLYFRQQARPEQGSEPRATLAREAAYGAKDPPQSTAEDHWRRRSVAFLGPVAFGLLGLLVWAQFVSGSWRTPVMNPGTVAFEGNQPLSRGTSAIYPPLVLSMVRHAGERPDSAHEHYREVARVGEPDADVVRVNAMWSGRARNYLLDHLGSSVSRLRQKLLYALHGFAWHDVSTAWHLDVLPAIPFSLLAATALLGFVAEARHARRAIPFFVLAAVQIGVMSAFYVSARQRLVLLPALIYFAVCAVRCLLGMRRGHAVLVALLVVVLALPLALPDDAMLDEVYRRRGYAEAEPLLDALRDDETPLAAQRPEVVEALSVAPWWIDWMRPAWVPQDAETLDESVATLLALQLDEAPPFLASSMRFDLVDMLARAGRLNDAEKALEPLIASGFQAYRGGRQPSDPRVLQARIDVARDRRAAAEESLRAALLDEPGDPFALAALAALVPAAAEESQRLLDLLDRYVGEADRRWLYGQALRRAGRPAEAVDQLEPLAARLSGLRDVWLQLSLALADAGRIDDAVAALLRANRLHPEPVLEVRAFAELARRWADLHPNDVPTQLLAIRILHQHGMFEEAARHLADLRGEDGSRLSTGQLREVEEIQGRLELGL